MQGEGRSAGRHSAVWLDPHSSADALTALFVPLASDRMEALPVNPWVSDPKHEGPRCLEAVTP
jgi:putative SOS response-associated peptidase YedK